MTAPRLRPKTAVVAAAILAAVTVGAATAGSTAAQDPPPPIVVKPLTPRNVVTDKVTVKYTIKLDGHRRQMVVKSEDPSRIVVAEITVQPGAKFPWHYHPGPVVVNVAQGELTYVMAHDCTHRPYAAGTSFVDPGNMIHSAYGSSDEVTVLIATFHDVPETGPMTITEGVEAPKRCVI
jgi:quercetin dioxygenase-like cupin family protein